MATRIHPIEWTHAQFENASHTNNVPETQLTVVWHGCPFFLTSFSYEAGYFERISFKKSNFIVAIGNSSLNTNAPKCRPSSIPQKWSEVNRRRGRIPWGKTGKEKQSTSIEFLVLVFGAKSGGCLLIFLSVNMFSVPALRGRWSRSHLIVGAQDWTPRSGKFSPKVFSGFRAQYLTVRLFHSRPRRSVMISPRPPETGRVWRSPSAWPSRTDKPPFPWFRLPLPWSSRPWRRLPVTARRSRTVSWHFGCFFLIRILDPRLDSGPLLLSCFG